MSIFNWFKREQNDSQIIDEPLTENISSSIIETEGTDRNEEVSPEIPEDVFIEFEKPTIKNHMEPTEEKSEVNDLKALYRFLEQSYEKKGYEDALMNPDTSSMDEQVQLLKNDLSLMISKVKTYYSTYTRTIDFHIETRKRNGMVETVDELETHKKNVMEEVSIVQSIEAESKQNTGLSQNLVLSYKRGFKNGFAAITFNNVLSRKN